MRDEREGVSSSGEWAYVTPEIELRTSLSELEAGVTDLNVAQF